jgi:hypothetical protein
MSRKTVAERIQSLSSGELGERRISFKKYVGLLDRALDFFAGGFDASLDAGVARVGEPVRYPLPSTFFGAVDLLDKFEQANQAVD